MLNKAFESRFSKINHRNIWKTKNYLECLENISRIATLKILQWRSIPFFVSERILNLGDVGSLRWLFTEIDKEFLINLVNKSRNLNKKTKNYWNLMLCQ